jgi:hypothetical protein
MRFILGLLIGAGLVFSLLAIIEKEEQRQIDMYRKWRDGK